jgi:hypothetical protein
MDSLSETENCFLKRFFSRCFSLMLLSVLLLLNPILKTDLTLSEPRDVRSMRLRFETPEAARAVAFMLQCEYDGCTLLTLPSIHDALALRTAIALTDAACCFAGDHDPLVLSAMADAPNPVSNQHSAHRMSRKAGLWQDVTPF